MKILFIASRFPSPAVKGDQARVLNFLKHLSKNNEIYFVCTTETTPSKKDREVVKSLVKELHTVSFNKKERYLNLLFSLVTLIPFQVMFFKSTQAQKLIKEIATDRKIDVVFCQMIRTAPYVSNLDFPKVIDYQDAYSLNMMRRFKSETGIVKWVSFVEWRLMKLYEKRMLPKFNVVTVVSENDKKVIGEDAKIRILPIGVDPWSGEGQRVENRLIFTGNLRYFPNRDAITWFTRDVFPIIRKSIKNVSLHIVGATPPRDVLSLSRFNEVEVFGNVPDIRKHLSTASLAVVPMRSGSGTQFKVIEALSVGTPVVVSKTAMNGLDFLSMSSVVVSDTAPLTFAKKVIKLLKNKEKMNSLATSGQTEVNKYYSWTKIGQKLESLLEEAVKNK